MEKTNRKLKTATITIKLEPDLYEGLKAKAGITPVGAIIRLLVKEWLVGNIILDFTK